MHGLVAALGTTAVVVGLAALAFLTLSPLAALLIGLGLSLLAVQLGQPVYDTWRELLKRAPAREFLSDVARAVEDLRPVGFVRVDGTLWRAVSVAGPVIAGQAVLIHERRGLSLMVVPLSPQEADALDVLAS